MSGPLVNWTAGAYSHLLRIIHNQETAVANFCTFLMVDIELNLLNDIVKCIDI